jgi:hypothetical protein
MNTPEGKVKQDVKKVLTERGIWFYMPVQTGYGVGGIPDFICCFNGLFIGLETKAPGKENTVTPMQQRTIDAIREHGGRATVISSAVALEGWLDLLASLET